MPCLPLVRCGDDDDHSRTAERHQKLLASCSGSMYDGWEDIDADPPQLASLPRFACMPTDPCNSCIPSSRASANKVTSALSRRHDTKRRPIHVFLCLFHSRFPERPPYERPLVKQRKECLRHVSGLPRRHERQRNACQLLLLGFHLYNYRCYCYCEK